jgi:membrane-associated phospholipid phosphatase
MPASLKYVGALFKSTWHSVRKRPALYIVLALLVVGVSIMLMPHDRELLNTIRHDPAIYPGIHDLGGKVSEFTMYTYTPLLLSTIIWLIGWRASRAQLKKAALVCLVAGTMGGILVNFLRPGLGRPRPRAEKEDKFYYFEMDSNMLSYPSGHVMSNMSGAVALAFIQPWVGVPYVAISCASGWSRMQRNAHYPTDVVVGALLGIGVGVAFARGFRSIPTDKDPLE